MSWEYCTLAAEVHELDKPVERSFTHVHPRRGAPETHTVISRHGHLVDLGAMAPIQDAACQVLGAARGIDDGH